MNDSDVGIVEAAGLTRAQAIVYLTLLELGQTKIGVIIEKTSLQSSVVHNMINRLIEIGLVSFVVVGKIRHYMVADPEVFLNYLDKQKEEIEEHKKSIQELLPKLHLLREESKQKREVEVYKGERGFKTAYIEEYEKMKPNSESMFLSQPEDIHFDDEVIPDVWNKINKILFDKNCIIKGIGPKSLKSIWSKRYLEKGYVFRYIEENFPWDVNILQDCVILSLWGEEPIAVKIRDKTFRDNAQRYFEEKWKEAKK